MEPRPHAHTLQARGLRSSQERDSRIILRVAATLPRGGALYRGTSLTRNRILMGPYRGSSVIRNHPPAGPYSRPMPRILGGS